MHKLQHQKSHPRQKQYDDENASGDNEHVLGGQTQMNASCVSTSSSESSDERRHGSAATDRTSTINSTNDLKSINDWQNQSKSNSPHSTENSAAMQMSASLMGNCGGSVAGLSAASLAAANSKALNELIQQQQNAVNMQRDRMTPTSLLATLHQQQQLQLQQAMAVAATQSGCPEHPTGKGVDCKTCELLECSFYGIGTDSLRMPRTPNKSPSSNIASSTSPADQLSMTISPTSQPAPSFTIGACPEHVNGRPFGVECSR